MHKKYTVSALTIQNNLQFPDSTIFIQIFMLFSLLKMSFLLLSLFMTPFHLTAPTQISYPSSYVPSSKKPFLHVITSLCANMDLEHNSTMQHLYHTAICLHAHPSY